MNEPRTNRRRVTRSMAHVALCRPGEQEEVMHQEPERDCWQWMREEEAKSVKCPFHQLD